uniref:Uncharacterized protein n=1 Tax=Compsopogon caeruleus TaxID=31354 RepID=A0A7S1THM4_9RHOD
MLLHFGSLSPHSSRISRPCSEPPRVNHSNSIENRSILPLHPQPSHPIFIPFSPPSTFLLIKQTQSYYSPPFYSLSHSLNSPLSLSFPPPIPLGHPSSPTLHPKQGIEVKGGGGGPAILSPSSIGLLSFLHSFPLTHHLVLSGTNNKGISFITTNVLPLPRREKKKEIRKKKIFFSF